MIVVNAIVVPFFEPTNWFDEGPKPKQVKQISRMMNTSSIDTSQIATYKQGVELRQQSDWDAGVVKIFAGEPGHVIPKRTFGQGITFRENIPEFADNSPFDPVSFLRTQENQNVFNPDIPTINQWPIITRDNDDSSESLYNDGTIEPLTIRAAAALNSTDFPYEAHAVYGELEAGSPDFHKASCLVTSVDYFDTTPKFVPYIDCADSFGAVGVMGYINVDQSKVDPFVDLRLVRDVPMSVSYSKDMLLALYQMDHQDVSGSVAWSTDSYVRYNQVASSCGWTYDSVQGVGADSIAFGGQVY